MRERTVPHRPALSLRQRTRAARHQAPTSCSALAFVLAVCVATALATEAASSATHGAAQASSAAAHHGHAGADQAAQAAASAFAASAVNESEFDSLVRSANAHVAGKRWEAAIRDLRSALHLDPTHRKTKRALFDACNAIRREDGNVAGCVERENLLAINPNNTDLHLLHHTLFFAFPPLPAACNDGQVATFLGTTASVHVACGAEYVERHPARNHTCAMAARCAAARAAAERANATGASVSTHYPLIDDEYWTWLDVLESAAFHVHSNASRFTMVDAYAGHGHWTAQAAHAVRRLKAGHPMHFTVVEPFPVHAQFLRETLHENRVCTAGVECVPYNAVISISEGNATIAAPAGAGDFDAQIVVLDESVRLPPPPDEPGAPPVYRRRARVPRGPRAPGTMRGLGSGRLQVEVMTLDAALGDSEQVDLVLLDLRRDEPPAAEAAVLRGLLGSGQLAATTRKLHIRTAPGPGEAAVRDALTSSGWVQLHSFPGGRVSETPWGPVEFKRGVQTFLNPKFQAGPPSGTSRKRSCRPEPGTLG